MLLPWNKHKRQTAELHEKLRVETQQVEAAQAQTFRAVVGQVHSRTTSDVLLHQLHLNGWTEMLQAAWKGRT